MDDTYTGDDPEKIKLRRTGEKRWKAKKRVRGKE